MSPADGPGRLAARVACASGPEPMLSTDRTLLLRLSGVTVAYRQVEAVTGATFGVAPGEVVGLVGAPGAGRSSLLLAIAGTLRPRAGTIWFDGRQIAGLRPPAIARLGLSHPTAHRILPEATAEENLRRAAAQRVPEGATWRCAGRGVVGDLEWWLAAFPKLAAGRRRLAQRLDRGAQAQLAVARGLMAWPKLLLLDEPFASQSIAEAEETALVLRAAREGGTAILYADDWPPTVPALADRLLRLEGGRVLPAP